VLVGKILKISDQRPQQKKGKSFRPKRRFHNKIGDNKTKINIKEKNNSLKKYRQNMTGKRANRNTSATTRPEDDIKQNKKKGDRKQFPNVVETVVSPAKAKKPKRLVNISKVSPIVTHHRCTAQVLPDFSFVFRSSQVHFLPTWLMNPSVNPGWSLDEKK